MWLTRTCYAFVCACALGLESRTQAALEAIVGRTTLALDTDVVLSLLSPDEPPHETVVALGKQWRELGGRVVVSNEVFSEVAHHASIAEKAFDNVSDLWPAHLMDRQILSKNAFVRGFGRLLEEKKADPRDWPRWIRQFQGKSQQDTTAIKRTLRNDYSFGELPSPNAENRRLASEVETYLTEGRGKDSASGWNDRTKIIRGDKARRDAKLFASLAQAIETGHDAGDGRATYLVTSSGRFRDVERRFRAGDPSFVLSVPAATYVLAMAPGRVLGMTALRAFLFDGRWRERVSDFELLALRVVRRSTQFDMPWVKRSQLLRDLRSSVEAEARERGGASSRGDRGRQSDWSGSDSEPLSKAIAHALDEVAADRKTEVELSKAHAEIERLKTALADERLKKIADRSGRPRSTSRGATRS